MKTLQRANKNLNLIVGVPHLGDVRLHRQCQTRKDLLRVEKVVRPPLLLGLDNAKMTLEVRNRHLPVNQVSKNVDQGQVLDVDQRKRAVNVAQQKNYNLWMRRLLL